MSTNGSVVRRAVTVGAAVTAAVALTASAPAFAHGSDSRPAYQVKAHLTKTSISVDKQASVRGTVSPKAPHHAADLQLKSGKRWVTVAKTHLSKKSAFAFSYQPADVGAFVLRVAVPGGSGASASNRLTVHVAAAPYTAITTDDNNTTCALAEGGTMQCWGRPFNYVDPAPVAIPGVTHASTIATTGSTQCAIVKAGAVECEGDNASGELGDGSTNYSVSPVQVSGIRSVISLSGDSAHFCAVKADKSVWCWGENRDDQDGTVSATEEVTRPVKVSGLGPATSVATGQVSSCATLSTGGVSCWGQPFAATSTSQDTPTPYAVGVIGRAASVSIGFNHACALMRSGAVDCWGDNSFGELGDAGVADGSAPVIATGITTARSVSAGTYFTCVLLRGGTVKCFGYDGYGELGDGTIAESGEAKVQGIADATAVVASDRYGCAVLARGTATCWGDNVQSTLGDGHSGDDRDTPQPVVSLARTVSIVDHATVVHAGHLVTVTGAVSPAAPGRVVTLTVFDEVTQKVMLTKRATLSARSRYSVHYSPTSLDHQLLYAMVAKSAHHSMGTSDELDLSVLPVVVSLAAGHGHGCAASATGQALCWGDDADGELGPENVTSFGPYQVSDLPKVRQVAAGLNFSCGLLTTGRVDCWGSDANGRLGDGPGAQIPGEIDRVTGITDATAIAAGENGACALLKTGSVQCWGSGDDGELGNGSGQDSPVPVAVTGLTNATAIAAGFSHTCALLKTGGVKCWGANLDGQLGRGSMAGSGTPVSVAGLRDATAISAGYRHTCALLTSGSVDCWGNNDFGELGYDTPNGHDAPVIVTGISTAVSIGAGGYHTCAVLKSGRVKCWGQGDLGELGNGHEDTGETPVTVSGLTDATSVVSGYDNSCAVLGGKNDTGDAWCWGNDQTGQDGDYSGHTAFDVPVRVAF